MASSLREQSSWHRHAKSVTFDSGPPQVNEYELTTPELSSVGTGSRESSYDSAGDTLDDEENKRDASIDREDSFDSHLEDATKTPVVGPEDWRHMSPAGVPQNRGTDVADPFDDKEEGLASAMMPDALQGPRPDLSRTDSNGSTGDRRPLPPLPGLSGPPSYSNSPQGLSSVAERRESLHRLMPSPLAPASASKSEILGITSSGMTLEERLRFWENQGRMLQHQGQDSPSPAPSPQSHHKMQTTQEQFPTLDNKPTPRISRDSILRKVKSQTRLADEMEFSFSSPLHSSTPEHSVLAALDPDTPLPSTETPDDYEMDETSVIIKQEQNSGLDLYAVPGLYDSHFESPEVEEQHIEESVIHHPPQAVEEDDDQSKYSQDSLVEDTIQQHEGDDGHEQGSSTPKQLSSLNHESQAPTDYSRHRMSLPEFASLLGDDDLDFTLQSYLSVAAELPLEEPKPRLEQLPDAPESPEKRPVTPQEQIMPPVLPSEDIGSGEEGLKTPESVIRRPKNDSSSPPSSPLVPEPISTIKAPGGRLKTRPSATPADMAAMAAARRQVSGEAPRVSTPPPVPDRHRDRPSLASEPVVQESTSAPAEDAAKDAAKDDDAAGSKPARRKSGRKSLVKLDVPVNTLADDLSSGLNQEFDRMLETQKRGYLMRQNTKVIVASSSRDESARSTIELPPSYARGTRSAGNSPRKGSQERPQSWSVEPWNSNIRRKSVRDTPGMPKKKLLDGPMPPLPGKESSVTSGLASVVENEPILEQAEAGVERGRLFVKVVGVKELSLPLVKGQQSWFNVTLDNGIHCVQTAWLELGKNAPIGQEFELIVLDDLEFTLTLQTEALKPPANATVESPTKSIKTPKSSAFSRVFASPKKRKEIEKKQQEQEQRAARQKQQEALAKKAAHPNAWDLLHGVIAPDGTFGRAYFSLKEHEARAYGRPYTLETDCFNEWATEPAHSDSSVKSKRGEVQKRPPYRIGKLELQLLFVPKPKGAQDADMPKSMNACIRELKEAEANASRKWEGHLSQQGGDCPYWRRRYFKLDGTKLTAFHETTRQPRATISLAKATKLIDDRSALLQKVAGKGGRRRSAFAEEEEGYMFVEEGFRIRFANGEIIDFYADSAAEKDGWMKVLGDTVGKDAGSGTWTDLVLARERVVGNERKVRSPPPPQQKAASGGPSNQAQAHATPSRHAPPPPPPIDKSPRHQQQFEPSSPRMHRRSQPAPRSMIF